MPVTNVSRKLPRVGGVRADEYITEELCARPSLRIALVTETWAPEINGVAMTLGRMADGLLARGHHLQLIRPRQPGIDPPAATVFEEILARGVQLPRYPDVRIGLPARNALIQQWNRQRPDVVHVATEGPLGWSAVSAARRLGIPVCSDFHTNFDHYSRHYGFGWMRKPVSAYLRRFHNRTAITFVPTEALAQSLRASGYRRVEVIARGVDTALFSPLRRNEALRSSWGVAPDGLAVISVGRLAPEKNLTLTLRAFEAIKAVCPAARLVLVGDGPMRAALERAHPEHHFAGMRSGEALTAHYASGDLFVFPSLTETYGNVTLEAMASGLTVVAFRCAAAAELIRSGEDGLLAPPDDESAFIDHAVASAQENATRRRLGAAARHRAEALGWEQIHDRFTAALHAVVRDARPTQGTEAADGMREARP